MGGGRYISASAGGITGSRCCTNSGRGGIRRLHHSDPTHTRTYIPAPSKTCYAPTRPLLVTRLPLAPPLACQNPVRYKYTTQSHPLSYFIHLPMKMELIQGSETSAISFVTPGNYPKENILHTGHGESLKSRKDIGL